MKPEQWDISEQDGEKGKWASRWATGKRGGKGLLVTYLKLENCPISGSYFGCI